MAMLTGIKAFESRWQSLQTKYSIGKSQKQILMQSMGRLVDNYATQEEIEDDLPIALRALFHQLVDAYLNGCWIEDDARANAKNRHAPTVTPAMLAAAQLRQRKRQQPTATSEAETYIVDDDAAASVRRAQSRAIYV